MTTIKMPVYNDIIEEYVGEKEVDLDKELSEHAKKEIGHEAIQKMKQDEFEKIVTGGGVNKKNPTALKIDGSELDNIVGNLIKFTNGSDEYLGDPIYINREHITTIFCNPTTGNTIIYNGHSGQNWVISEKIEKVIELLKQ